ncbi:hypothetical protein HQN60_00135 [Deefgea piscis]|uniref:Uncharacterized protein n=1 Tax=Deefgea piscis TaxID=2739061 RepID=A0A6M8SJQ2_9NEIS|nr:hypothetical protein [Deefgea piscis]QKJ65273.1 hypothetical protein HQN60_00135 [Deefgea piscis]
MTKPIDKSEARILNMTERWATWSKWDGGKVAKTYRGKARTASTVLAQIAAVLNHNEMDAKLWAGDVKTLLDASALLARLGNEFEVAQRKGEKIKKEHTAKRVAEEKAIEGKIIREILRPLAPDAAEMMQLCSDLLAFISHRWNISKQSDFNDWCFDFHREFEINRANKQGNVDLALNILAEAYRQDSWQQRIWPAFIEWRKTLSPY